MAGRWWQRQAMALALLVALTAVRLQADALDWRDVSPREAAAVYLLAYVAAFWAGLAVRWPERRLTARESTE